MKNSEIFAEARRYQVVMEDIAFEMGLSPTTLRRMLRKDIDCDKWAEIMNVIHRIGRRTKRVSE